MEVISGIYCNAKSAMLYCPLDGQAAKLPGAIMLNDDPPKIPKITKKERREMMRALSIFSQVGITMVACVMIGVFIGRFLDTWLNTTPWLLLLFTVFGAGAAFKSLYDMSKRFK